MGCWIELGTFLEVELSRFQKKEEEEEAGDLTRLLYFFFNVAVEVEGDLDKGASFFLGIGESSRLVVVQVEEQPIMELFGEVGGN